LNKRVVGDDKEMLACSFLEEKGCRIIERNFRCWMGEIDIIARDGSYLCFIEVKFRKDNSYGDAKEAVNYSKQKRISKVSSFYLYSKKVSFDSPIRYDVIAESVDDGILTFDWVKNAFEYCN
jgi:putative endonuclease